MNKKYWILLIVIVAVIGALGYSIVRNNSRMIDIPKESTINYSNRELRINRELTSEERDWFIAIISSDKLKFSNYPSKHKMAYSEEEYFQVNETGFYFYDEHPYVTVIRDGAENTFEIDPESWDSLTQLLGKLRKK